MSLVLVTHCMMSSGCHEPGKRSVVFAASSLTDVLTTLGEGYQSTGREAPLLSFASSSALARQIEYGAEPELFLSANRDWVDYLVRAGLAKQQQVQPWVTNSLVVVRSPSYPKTNVPWFEDRQTRLALGDPKHVPAGMYAVEALQKLGYWDTWQNRVLLTASVRQVVFRVTQGEAEYGVVYATDAGAFGLPVVERLPESSHTPITYFLADIAQNEQSRAFRAFIVGASGKEVLDKQGFGTSSWVGTMKGATSD